MEALEILWSLPAAPERGATLLDDDGPCRVLSCRRVGCDGDCIVPMDYPQLCVAAVAGWNTVCGCGLGEAAVTLLAHTIASFGFRLAGMEGPELAELVHEQLAVELIEPECLLAWLGWA